MKKELVLFFILVLITNSLETIAIIGTNDIHGAAFPTSLRRQDNNQTYTYGGLVYMARLIQIIQDQFPNRVLYLDGGDQFQGGLESSKLISSGQIMNDFYNTINLQASAIGNHQFDFGPDFLLPYMQAKNGEGVNLAANLRSETGQQNFLPKQRHSKMFDFPSGIKIGVIGLSTLETPASTSGFSSGLFPQYKFLEYKQIVLQQANKLRQQGANAVLIVSHVGDRCYGELTYQQFLDISNQQQPCLVDEITNLINSLPEGTIDGIVQGHRHSITHHFINEKVPYIGTINGGYYFNVMYFTFDDNKRIINKTIEGPIPVCERLFENTKRCNYLTGGQLEEAGQLVKWRFHHQQVYAHKQLNEIFNAKWLPLMEQYLEELVSNELQLSRTYSEQSELGNIITTITHNALPQLDFVIINPGGFRTQWFPGVIQYQHFYNMFPFDSSLVSFEINGSELFEMIKIIQSGQKGFYHFWNIFNQVKYNSETKEKQFISAKFANGTQIDPSATYRGVTIDFLLQGGDDFADVFGQVYEPRNIVIQGDLKNLLRPQLVKIGTIKKNTWIDPQNPRIIVHPWDYQPSEN